MLFLAVHGLSAARRPAYRDHRPERHRARTLAALRTISQRLSDALHTNPEDDVAAGYRDGILIALDLTEEQERAVRRDVRCATLTG